MALDEFIDTGGSTVLHLMDIDYQEVFGEPIVYLWARTQDGERTFIEVEGHTPSFYVRKDDVSKRTKNHDWVTELSQDKHAINGDSLVRGHARLPKHVGGGRDVDMPLRDYFGDTWEADVFYTNRFLIDTGIKTHFEVDLESASDGRDAPYRVHVDDLSPVDADWTATPRTLVADIEVLSPDGFPEPGEANQPVTAITAYDNYTDQYSLWVLKYPEWEYTDGQLRRIVRDLSYDFETIRVFENESMLLDDFNTYVNNRRPDMLSGWNSSATHNGDAFDYPYLINRSKELNVSSYSDWSPLGQVWTTRRGTGELQPGAKGIIFFDYLQGYKKTIWSEPDGGYSLENIAAKETDMPKLDLDDEIETDGETAIDAAYKRDPELFIEYNVRDVAATVAINDESEITQLYQNIRTLTGAQFGDCHNNIDLLDLYILRKAEQKGVALPTNEQPDRDWYYGAHVFEPELGLHENVVYPDLWSMYPNMIRNVNMSPETIVGTADDLADSQYDESDCRWTYIDTRDTEVKKETDPQYEKLYFLKPSVKTGFMTEVVDELMGLKDHYDGTELYGPVKQVVNSVYGVYGDSNSYGKGYRLYDWRIAEGITLGGRKMIQDTAKRFVDELNEIKTERGYDGQKPYLVGGDTDSAMASVPFVSATTREDYQTVVDIAQSAANAVNEWYDDWTREAFNIEDGDHYCELEIESYAPRAFIPRGITKKKAKKRYAEVITWDEGEWITGDDTVPSWVRNAVSEYDSQVYDGEFSVTGIDIVRSDRAPVTQELSQRVLQLILRVEDRAAAKELVYDEVNSTVTAIQDGTKPLSYIARPRGMSSHPEEYGSPSNTPMPTYRGAKYVHKHFEWEDMVNADKPQLLYIDTVCGDYPRTYTAQTAEDGDRVDAIAVTQPERVPETFEVDIDTMVEKTVEDPLTPLFAPLQWSVDDALADTSQSDIAAFM